MTASSGGTLPSGYRLACWPSDPEAGVSIVELLVSLMILSLGAALSVGVLSSANRGIEQAELDLRAAIYLGELSATDTATWAAPDSARPAGPGRLILETGAGPIAGSLRTASVSLRRERVRSARAGGLSHRTVLATFRRVVMSSSPRLGALLLEILVALTLGAVVLGSLARIASAGVRWTRSLSDQTEAIEVVRTIWVVIDEEVRAGRAGRDWRVDENGVLRLRSFQGIGRVCLVQGGSPRHTVVYRGRRPPDPRRDSILALGPGGTWRSLDLVSSVRSDNCEPAPEESVYSWTWNDPSGGQPVVVRNFEPGSYHLADGAFRYQPTGGGRQPLTVERLTPSSTFRSVGAALEVTVSLDRATASAPGPFR